MLVAIAAFTIIAGVWLLVLFDGYMPSSQTTTGTSSVGETTSDVISDTTAEMTTAETTTSVSETTASGYRPLDPNKKYIALTFDDGPHATYTSEILDVLERHGAKATFFVNGYNLSGTKALSVRRAVSLGCEIGNHTQNHKRLTTLSAAELYEEIASVNKQIYDLCGYEVNLIRPPYGSTNLSVMQNMYDSGLRMYSILWNNDSEDWSFCADYRNGKLTKEQAVQKAYELVMKSPLDGAIVLMHDIQAITPEILEWLLDRLEAEGYQFVTVSELLNFESMGEDAYFSKFYAQNFANCLK